MMLHREKSTREATNADLCVKVQPHDVDSDKADSDVTFMETAMVVDMSGSCTLPTQFFVDGCYTQFLLLYTYRGFSTTTQGQSTCRRHRSLILE